MRRFARARPTNRDNGELFVLRFPVPGHELFQQARTQGDRVQRVPEVVADDGRPRRGSASLRAISCSGVHVMAKAARLARSSASARSSGPYRPGTVEPKW